MSRFRLQHSLNAKFVSPVPHMPPANFSPAGCQTIKSLPNAGRLKINRSIESTYFAMMKGLEDVRVGQALRPRTAKCQSILQRWNVQRYVRSAEGRLIYLFDIYSSQTAGPCAVFEARVFLTTLLGKANNSD